MQIARCRHPGSRWAYLPGCAALCLLIALGCPRVVRAASTLQAQMAATLARTPDPMHGAQLFEFCAGCHGSDGGGSADGRVPAIAAQAPRVLIRQLLEYRVAQRADLRMSAASHTQRLPDAQALADVAAYIGSLPVPIQSAPAATLRRESPPAEAFASDAYAQQCANCHGSSAQGEGDAPRLAGQHYPFLMERLTDAAAGRALQPVHAPLLTGLGPEDLDALATYLSQLSPTPRRR